MIREAFAERTPPVIEGNSQVIARRAVMPAVERQSVGQNVESGKVPDSNPLEQKEE
jgi:hypothetical protein